MGRDVGGGPMDQVRLAETDVRRALAETAGAELARSIGAEETFDQAGLDSLDQAQLHMRLEEAHGVRIADEDFEACNSIAAIVAYVRR